MSSAAYMLQAGVFVLESGGSMVEDTPTLSNSVARIRENRSLEMSVASGTAHSTPIACVAYDK